MALFLISTILAIILSCTVWLVIGDRFPLTTEPKLPTLNNIVIYAAILIVPLYLAIFFTFG